MVLRDRKDGKETIAFVMKEMEEDQVMIQLDQGGGNKVEYVMERPTYLKETGSWIFPLHDPEYEVVEFDPVRIKVLERGNVHILFHRLCYIIENDKLVSL